MAHLGTVPWPPDPIRTERLTLRRSESRDRAGCVELLASPAVNTYLGGPRPPDELERVPEVPGRRPGFFVVELGVELIGTVMLERRDGRPAGSVRPEIDLGG
jgi:hypothetical protein